MASYIIKWRQQLFLRSLNPYCSGQWSRTLVLADEIDFIDASLNPYCSGQWSRTRKPES